LSLPQQKSLKTTIDGLLKAKMIVPTITEYASPIVIVNKSDRSNRVCVNCREPNEITVRDAYPLPAIDALLQRMQSFRMDSKIDLRSAYHQVHVTEATEGYSAF
jgi:hypothetical protein